jgi:hypothetical protein
MTGLKQKILLATSEEEVKSLLAQGKTYEFASRKTRNSWVNASRRKSAGEKYVATKTERPKKKARRSR